jgi:hypothetical protein
MEKWKNQNDTNANKCEIIIKIDRNYTHCTLSHKFVVEVIVVVVTHLFV